jgi:pSer/pThr/pTyr-binding forkhead associated (FHA) protein
MPPRLIAVSDDARRSIDGEFVTIDRLPFRVGRDSRWPRTSRTKVENERRKGIVGQVNDVYLFEDPLAPFHHISREHFLIEAESGRYFVVDRRSVCGTVVAGQSVGGDRAGGRIELRDQDVLIVGTPESPYVFKFAVS